MQVDKTTLQDISIFHREEEQSIFFRLNKTHTNGGREYLRSLLSKPLNSVAEINDRQATIQQLMEILDQLPKTITNGTIMVIENFFDTVVDHYPKQPNLLNSLFYKIINASDFSVTEYSVSHFVGFITDIFRIKKIFDQSLSSKQLKIWNERIEKLLSRPVLQTVLQWENGKKLSPTETLWLGNYLRTSFKEHCFELLDIYSQIDAIISLAIVSKNQAFHFPSISETEVPYVNAEGVYHILLETPISYDFNLNQDQNFMFLTGANMAGKSTFIKAIGTCIYLAHIGMAVPAKQMNLSRFDGLLTNIQVEDNILRGESFFFNEVQRIKRTVDKVRDGKKWLILIDELFKGTNVQDAMKCSLSVIEGLRKTQNALYILSTHLYEIGEELKQYNNIAFRFFETRVENGQFMFSYQLLEGVSNDRLGYLILEREGVTKMLEEL